MTGEQAETEAKLWGRRVADAYAEAAHPAMSERLREAYADMIGRELVRAIVLGVPVSAWPSYVNPLLDREEGRDRTRGPRLGRVDFEAGTVTMVRAPG